MYKIKLHGDRVLIKPDEVENKIDSTIDLQKTDTAKAKEKSQRGTVMEIGPDCKDNKVGDYVHFNPWAGMEFDNPNTLKLVGVEKKKDLIMTEGEIMATLERVEA